jgi:hypothetical protein
MWNSATAAVEPNAAAMGTVGARTHNMAIIVIDYVIVIVCLRACSGESSAQCF